MSSERVGCWIVRYGDDEVRLFGEVYPKLLEGRDDVEIHVATWEVTV